MSCSLYPRKDSTSIACSHSQLLTRSCIRASSVPETVFTVAIEADEASRSADL